MKFCTISVIESFDNVVAPFTGAWIEITALKDGATIVHTVAPFTGAWIEIQIPSPTQVKVGVAPFTGAWIEIVHTGRRLLFLRRTLHGCVD